jgi:hypothetical protein
MSVTVSVSRRVSDSRDEIARIAARHGVTRIRVFGSVARGEDRDTIDVDFLITVGEKHSAWFPGGLIADLEELLGCRVDVVTEDALHPRLRDRILSEAVEL